MTSVANWDAGTKFAFAVGELCTYAKFCSQVVVVLYTFHETPFWSSCWNIGGKVMVLGTLSSMIPPHVPATRERWLGRLSLITEVK